MEQRAKSDHSGNKKRSTMLHQASSNPLISALAGNPEAFKVSAKSTFTSSDYENINILIDAMNDMGSTEDNDGMIKSWNRLKIQKAAKVASVCEDLLVAMKRKIALKGQSLSDHKKSSNHYATFEDRFRAVQETLKTQKTVCKHLLEDPYLYQVVDDPIYASMRVTNNRRVNKGKKDAIEQGRRLMGLKGNGKGHPLIKQESSEMGEEDDEYEEEEAVEERFETRRFRDRSPLKRSNYDEQESLRGSIEEDESPRPAKKPKRTIRPKRQIQIQNVDTASNSVNTSDSVSEDLGNVKIEQGPLSPYDISREENDPNGPLSRPLNTYFVQGNTNDAPYPFNRPPFDTTYGAYLTTPYQTFDQPSYPAPQQFAPHQLIFPQQFNTAKANFPNAFDGLNEPEPYGEWLNGFRQM